MTKLGLAPLLLAASLLPVTAQVKVEVTLPQDQYLQGESIPAAVRIINRSGQPLHLGAEEDWLTFSVESRDGFVVSRTAEMPAVVGEFDLESSQVATKRVNLAPGFILSQPGRYTVTATVKIKAWDREVASPPKAFDIIHGAVLWQQEFGLPATGGAAPEVRKYVLEQANYLKGHLRLYVRLTDGSGARALRVLPVGQMVSISQPEGQVDRLSNLHVLFANGPRSFSYTVYNPDGELLVRQSYEYQNTRPRLAVDQEGKISVLGGVRRLTALDLPASPSSEQPGAQSPK